MKLIYSNTGLHLTEHFEGCRLVSYQDSKGIWTIGYGHTFKVVEGMTCTQAQAEAWLMEDVQRAANAVNVLVKINLTQEEFDALVDFVFNLGIGNFRDSTLLRLINQNSLREAANEFPRWDKCAGVVLEGLRKRRIAEQALFLQGVFHAKAAA